ncbi:MAG: thiamine pyrophosphate-dependent enzyme, partial [Bacillota bacterium]|nr:thiamine pyrophosphate-dependent enzyme [Bacillota bacterium]
GCSSIYGGNLPTTPYTVNKDGRGVAWSNSLFEDNAEFGLGMRLALDKKNEFARELLVRFAGQLPEELVKAILTADQSSEGGIQAQRARVAELKKLLAGRPEAGELLGLADALVKKTVWIVGGDGWAYDIGYGGLDHVLGSGRNVNILVLDTEVYSNTGGQASKATPRAAVAKFAAAGKSRPKKDLALMAMHYGAVYVARVALGANDAQTLKTFLEAEAYDGPSIIIAYSHCIAHGFDLVHGLDQQKLAVQAGHWPLFRYNPMLIEEGKNPFTLDSKAPTQSYRDFIMSEVRYNSLSRSFPERAEKLFVEAEKQAAEKFEHLEKLKNLYENE